MVFDPEEHELKRLRFLAALRQLAEEQFAKDGKTGDPAMVFMDESAIAKRAGLSDGDADRIGSELLHEDLVEGVSGPQFCLTREGCQIAEKHLYEKTLLAKRRKAAALASGALQEVGKSIWTNVASGVGGLMAGWVMGYNWDSLRQWVKAWFGH